jgi:hypothetical protein
MREQIIADNLIEYTSFNYIGTMVSFTYFLGPLYRFIYNQFSKRKVFYDIWLLFDVLSGVVNIAALNIIGSSTPKDILNEDTKVLYDYYTIIVLLISWLRFFSYFLVFDKISKISITLIRMVREMISFSVVLLLYLILVTSIFTTLFRNAGTEDAL